MRPAQAGLFFDCAGAVKLLSPAEVKNTIRIFSVDLFTKILYKWRGEKFFDCASAVKIQK